MTYDKLCELTETMTIEQETCLWKEYANESCTACNGQGHSYSFDDNYVEPCDCLEVEYDSAINLHIKPDVIKA
jgi:hypothetical protein